MKKSIYIKNLILLIVFVGFVHISWSQNTSPTLEFISTGASTSAVGPAVSTSVSCRLNTNNPNGEVYIVPDITPLTVTYEIKNQQYDHAGIASPAGSVFFGYSSMYPTAAPIYTPLSSYGQSSDEYFSSRENTIGTGINAATNYSVQMMIFTNPLYSQTNTSNRIYMADLEITFSRPIQDPVLHFAGLGCNQTGYVTATSAEFDVFTNDISTQAVLFKLSGTTPFLIAENKINHNGTSSTQLASYGAYAGSGSVLVRGTSITKIILKTYIRGFGTTNYWATGTTSLNGDGYAVGVSVPTDRVVVTNDNFKGYQGAVFTTPSVLANDEFNNTVPTTELVNLTWNTTPPAGITLNADGTITVASTAASGTYNINYTMCSKKYTTICKTATATIVINPPSALVITKTAKMGGVNITGLINANDVITYGVTVLNQTENAITNLTLNDILPANVTYIPNSVRGTIDGNPITVSAPPSIILAGSNIGLAVNKSAVIEYKVSANNPLSPGVLTNTATASAAGVNAKSASVTLNANPTCRVGNNPPTLSGASNITSTCGTGNIKSLITQTGIPTGTKITYHTNNPPTSYNRTGTPENASYGIYYAAYYDSIAQCYSPVSTVYVPKCLFNICPSTTVDLTAMTTSAAPTGSVLQWYKSNPPSEANKVADPTNISESGIYWAAFYDAANACYSPVGTPVKVTINTPPTLTIVSTNNICNGGSAGSVSLTVNGGTPPYNYAWQGPDFTSSTKNISGLKAGKYYIEVEDNNRCKANDSVTITEPDIITITLLPANTTICNGGSINLTSTVGGGKSPYNYEWSPSTGLSATNTQSVVATPITTTTYTLKVKDAENCEKTKSVTVTVNDKPTVTLTASSGIICSGSSVTLTAGGATTYAWDNGLPAGSTHSVSPDATTTYTVTGTDANDCTNTASVTVTVNSVAPGEIADNQTVCYNGNPAVFTSTTDATAPSGATISYQWEQSTNNGSTWAVISEATLAIYDHGAITQTTQFRRKSTSILNGVTCTAYSNIVTVTVNNCIPVAINDINVTVAGMQIAGNVLTNDYDPDPSLTLTATVGTFTTLAGGSVIINADGSYTYTPPEGYTGNDSFTYTVCNSLTPTPLCSQATVSISVVELSPAAGNSPPVANNDNFKTESGNTVMLDVLVNDIDPEDNPLTISLVTALNSTGGAITLTSTHQDVYDANGVKAGTAAVVNNKIEFIADANFAGNVQFKYKASDGTVESNQSTVTLKVLPDNGVNNVYATDDAFSKSAGATITGEVLQNDNYEGSVQPIVKGVVSAIFGGTKYDIEVGTPKIIPGVGEVTITNTGTITLVPVINKVPTGFAGTLPVIYTADNSVSTSSATAYLTLTPTISADLDTEIIQPGQTGTVSVLTNDKVNEVAATTDNVTLTQVSTSDPKVTLNTTTGFITVAEGTPPGIYEVVYKICDKVITTLCSQATTTVAVPVDTDGDGIPDYLDLDDDNDGILDTDELTCSMPNLFLNGVLEDNIPTSIGILPTGWLNVTHDAHFCMATAGAGQVTPDLVAVNAPPDYQAMWMQPMEGNTCVSGMHYKLSATTIFHEGIQQTVSGLEPGKIYRISFQQAVKLQNTNINNMTGQWKVYMNNNLLATSELSTSALPNAPENYVLTNVQWDYRTFDFIAISSNATFAFMPWDADETPNVRMAIDDIKLQKLFCDFDGDLISNHLDLDSDGDGCFDAVEGDENVAQSELITTGDYAGAINIAATGGIGNLAVNMGVPNLVNSGGTADVGGDVGQGIGVSQAKIDITINSQPTTATVCPGSSATFNAKASVTPAAPLTYQWQEKTTANGATWTNISGATGSVASGEDVSYIKENATVEMNTYMYRVLFTTENNCYPLKSDSAILNVNDKPIVTLTASSANICSGASVTLTASGATTYAWDNGLPAGSTHSVNPTTTTTYTVTGTDANGCTNTASVKIIVNAKPTITGKTTVCVGSTTQLGVSVSNSNNFILPSSNAFVINASTGGTTPSFYGNGTLNGNPINSSDVISTITNNGGLADVVINPDGTFTVPAGATEGTNTLIVQVCEKLNVTNCALTNVIITIVGGGLGKGVTATPSWTSATPSVATVDDNGLVTGVSAGTSEITYTDSNGCSNTVTVKVNAIPTFIIDTKKITCFQSGDGEITIRDVTGKAPFTYYLMDNAGDPYTGNNYTTATNTVKKDTNTHTFEGLSEGIYSIKVVDDNGCEAVQ